VIVYNSSAQDLPPIRAGEESIGKILQPTQAWPPELARLLTEFEKQRMAYLDAQRQLFKELQGTTEQERAAIRECFQTARAKWLEDTKAFCAEMRCRVEEFKVRLPNRQEILANAGPLSGARPGIN